MKLSHADALKLYDELKYSVVPIVLPVGLGECSCSRPECGSPGKHPALQSWTTYQQRRPTPEEIAKWWPYHPRYSTSRLLNIGVVTGRVSNLVVLDLDDVATYEMVTAAAPWLLDTMIVQTGRGYHLYLTPSEPAGRTTSFLLNGRRHHVKSEGGYVVAPPSVHESGNVYTIAEPALRPLVFDPRDLAKVLIDIGAEEAKPDAKDVTTRANDWVTVALQTDAPQGGRNEQATQLAGWFRNVIAYRSDVTLEILSLWNDAHCKPPLPRSELETLVRHKYQRYPPPLTGPAGLA